MIIKKSIRGGDKYYEARLSQEDLDNLCTGDDCDGFVVASHECRDFRVFYGGFSRAWRPFGHGYSIAVGVESSEPKLDRASEEFRFQMETAINESGVRPIEDPDEVVNGKPKNLGYVVMSVEPQSESN